MFLLGLENLDGNIHFLPSTTENHTKAAFAKDLRIKNTFQKLFKNTFSPRYF
jgi:hypothetical protein